MTDQAKYQLAIDNTVDFPVTLEIKSGRVTKTFNMRLTGRRLSVPEWNRFFGPNADNPSLTTADFLREHITDWRDQRLVVDEKGIQAPFSPEAFDILLSVVGAEMIIFIGYQKAIFASDGDAGRRKNSQS